MPIEAEFGELYFGRIRQRCRRTGKECIVWIVVATDNVSEIIERRVT